MYFLRGLREIETIHYDEKYQICRQEVSEVGLEVPDLFLFYYFKNIYSSRLRLSKSFLIKSCTKLIF